MKKILLLFALFSGTYNLKSQPTITSNVFPVIGDTISLALDSILSPPGNSGANVTWNFSNLPQHVFVWRIYFTPLQTPYSSKFPGATLCKTDGAGSVYTYWNNTSSQSNYYGFVEPGIYDQNYNSTPIAYYKYPIHYNDTFSSTLTATTNPGAVQGSGKYYFNADGWGTLQLPKKTVPNTLRTKSVIYIGDSSVNNYSLTVEYAWYQANHKEPLLVISSVIINHQLHKKFVFFDNSSTNTVNELTNNIHFTLFPNPATTELNIDLNGMNEDYSVLIIDALGKVVLKTTIQNSSFYKLDISDLSKGIFYVKISSGEHDRCQTFIKE